MLEKKQIKKKIFFSLLLQIFFYNSENTQDGK